jgi:NhaP-type Na+/H+ and K+/H+ antiporter
MNGASDLLSTGHALMEGAHHLILVGGVLGVLSILGGLVSRRIGAPVLLIFLGLGMLAGEDGPGGIPFDDFHAAYLIGSIALAVILFEGGLTTHLSMLRLAFWPALVLATIGVLLTTAIFGGAAVLLLGAAPAGALLAGAAVAPTDAAAVNTLLRQARAAVPERVTALLEVESGLNDPMSVFLSVLFIHIIAQPGWSLDWPHVASALLLFVEEMAGGAAIGFAGGAALVFLLRRLPLEPALAMVLVLAAGLSVFGLAQSLGCSGFLAIYIAAVMTGAARYPAQDDVGYFFGGLAWLAQIVLFLMLGLLVTPHELAPYVAPGLIGAAVLILIARPVAVFLCLLPFRYRARESAFASWVGLRGAVPIYLSIVPALADPDRDVRLFAPIFVLVVASLIVQGGTIGPAARLLGYGRAR